jgi:endonuclease YncB( thermonuclease family)
MMRPYRAGFALLACLVLSPAARADDVVAADKIISGDEITLKDGHVLRLAGIKAVSPQAIAFLQANMAGHDLDLQNPVIDRYGRVSATVFIQGQKESVENTMLREGLAFVYPATGDDAQLDEMLNIEKAARQEKHGYWADHPDTSADNAEPLYGKYGFVTGIVTKAERVKNKVYLNFGADWRTDFTIAIAAHDLRAFKKQDLNPLDWQGKHLRVRGWIKRDFGPMITVTDPHQIELLP